MKRGRVLAIVLSVSMLCGVCGGCAGQERPAGGAQAQTAGQDALEQDNLETEDGGKPDAAKDSEQAESGDGQTADGGAQEAQAGAAQMSGRPLFLRGGMTGEGSGVTPCVEGYVLEPDLSNVENLNQFYMDEEMTEKLSQNGFLVRGDAGREFFEIYEMNRYGQIPNFVTVDSLMHTYHLYFSYLLKRIEREKLSEDVAKLTEKMLADSVSQYEKLKGSEWESAARRNVAFFTVAANLLDVETTVSSGGSEYVADVVEYELERINKAEGIAISEIRGDEEDYSQYKPRGYYEGDEKLEKYFKAMMWYGRIHFDQLEESGDMNRSALLMTKALMDDAEGYRLWESVYAVTSFFAGASDDLGVCEYAPVFQEAYGEDAAVEDLIGNEEAFEAFCAAVRTLPAPQINSIPIYEGEDNVIPGFRFMGQRFTIDASIMQKLIFQNVGRNSAGEKRMLPDVLDVPAALGSDTALALLNETGVSDYEGYSENMEKLRQGLSKENDTLWSASLYANWLNTLRPLLSVKGEGYPTFMQGEEWAKKDLECFAGSFTELKHDTILYSKQVIAEMGGGYDEEIDDRGYVEPEPLVYERFGKLADLTAQGLEEYGMLDAAEKENLTRLSQMAEQLLTISNKELCEETLTDDEYEFIRCYGGSIEHFWYEAVKEESNEDDVISSQLYPAAIVVDIATNPDGAGEVLEAATGNPSELVVVVRVDGKLKIAKGSVYSFYQFPWPLSDRLTDAKWRYLMGISPDEDYNYSYDTELEQPEWTQSYRIR